MNALADSLLGKIIYEDRELFRHEAVTGFYRSLTPARWQQEAPQNAPAEKQTDPALDALLLTPARQEQIPYVATSPMAPSPGQSPTHETVTPDPQGSSLNRRQQRGDGKKRAAKGSKLIVSSEMHVEIATMAARIQQLKERLLAQSKELRPADSPCTSEHPVEENPFPDWLN